MNLENIVNRFKGLYKGHNTFYFKDILNICQTAAIDAAGALNKALMHINSIQINNGYTGYEATGKTMHVCFHNEAISPKGKYVDFFHECGHAYFQSLTHQRQLGFYASAVLEWNQYLEKHPKDPRESLKFYCYEDWSSALQDVINAVSYGKVALKWGHPSCYWEVGIPSDRWKRVADEITANLFSCVFNYEQRVTLQQIFPDTYQVLINLMCIDNQNEEVES